MSASAVVLLGSMLGCVVGIAFGNPVGDVELALFVPVNSTTGVGRGETGSETNSMTVRSGSIVDMTPAKKVLRWLPSSRTNQGYLSLISNRKASLKSLRRSSGSDDSSCKRRCDENKP